MTHPGSIALTRDLPHSPAHVWRALTEPEFVSKWWAEGDIRPEVGHRFALDMGTFGNQTCEVKVVEPEKLFVYDFGIGMLDTTISWTLEPNAEGTTLHFEQSGFDLEGEMGKQAIAGMSRGWPVILGKLAEVLDETGSEYGA